MTAKLWSFEYSDDLYSNETLLQVIGPWPRAVVVGNVDKCSVSTLISGLHRHRNTVCWQAAFESMPNVTTLVGKLAIKEDIKPEPSSYFNADLIACQQTRVWTAY